MRTFIIGFVSAGLIFSITTTYIFSVANVDVLHSLVGGVVGGIIFGIVMACIALPITKIIKQSVLAFLALAVSLPVIGLPAGLILWLPSYVTFFSRWEQISQPPEPVSEIIDAGSYGVLIMSMQGNIYACNSRCKQEHLSNAELEERNYYSAQRPPAHFQSWMLPWPPGKIIASYATTILDIGSGGNLVVVLLKDGSVWRTRQAMTGEWSYLIVILWGIIGGLTGFITSFVVTVLRKKY